MRGRSIELIDGAGGVLAQLSARGRAKWNRRRGRILSLRLADKKWRDQSQSSPAYCSLLRCERWVVPVVEVRWDCATGEMERSRWRARPELSAHM